MIPEHFRKYEMMLYYFFLMADGEVSAKELQRFLSICDAMEIPEEDAEEVISYAKKQSGRPIKTIRTTLLIVGDGSIVEEDVVPLIMQAKPAVRAGFAVCQQIHIFSCSSKSHYQDWYIAEGGSPSPILYKASSLFFDAKLSCRTQRYVMAFKCYLVIEQYVLILRS